MFSQIFNGDQYPPSVRWRQIQTENFQLIYPSAFEDEAQQLASKLVGLHERVSVSLGKRPRKISIILHNQTVESNGNVQLAPRRSEFYTTPPQQGDFQKWLDNLAIHELRHVAQFDKLTGYLRAPFFEQLALAIYGVTLPAWFFEGDAVVAETRLSNAGRGRLPSWEMSLRANLLSGKKYSYQKDYLGSLKDVTPGFYELGYFMTAALQDSYGPAILDSLMTRMAKLPVRPYNFTNSLHKFTGYGTRKWHGKVTGNLSEKWHEQVVENDPTDYPILPLENDGKPTSWLLPQALPNGRVIALYRGVREVPKIVILDTSGRHTDVVKTGRQTEAHFAYAAGKIVWDEVRRHSRYGKRTYSVINVYDLQKNTYRQLTRKSRYFSPTLHPNGTQVATVAIDESNKVSLVLLDVGTGAPLASFPSPENILLQTPSFDPTGTKVVATGISEKGATLVELDIPTGTYRYLLDWQVQQIERPVYAGSRIVFKAHFNDIDNLYALDQQGIIHQLTNARFGAFNPSADTTGNQLWFNNYQVNGHEISRLKMAGLPISHFKAPVSQKDVFTTKDTLANEIWPSTAYNGIKNLVNFHSLSIDNGNFDNIGDIKPGIYWLSDDLLNTTQIRLGYHYDSYIRSSTYSASVAYQRFFPKFSLAYSNRGQLVAARVTNGQEADTIRVRWRENVATLQMDIPLAFYRLNHVFTTGVNAATSYTNRYGLSEPQLQEQFINGIRFPMSYQAYFNHNVRQSALDLAPRWGQHVSVSYRHFPFDGNLSGEHLSLRTAFYFPGLWRNHSLLARFSYQQRSGTYQLIDDIPLVSGYDQLSPIPVDNTLLFSYRFPFAYPDWSIGPLAYIKRFKGGLFADFQNVRTGKPLQPRTFGAELRADMNLLRFYLPDFDFGVKLVYANETSAQRRLFATYSIGYRY
ncbi:TolB family protein [Parapedobacter sp. 2B3]|uniref:TolB family protein n=1 Tax=Parapedobacter sp. 2B3 TaxID=3342381 RepID=UPI0035B5DA0E